jgi:hypothetical protein
MTSFTAVTFQPHELVEDANSRDARAVMQETSKFFGVVLGLAALGLWLVPGAFEDGATVLVRLVISFLFVGIAVCLWGAGRQRFDDEFVVDFSTQRLSHVSRGKDGIARVRGDYGLDPLSLRAGVVLAREADGTEIVRMVLPKRPIAA